MNKGVWFGFAALFAVAGFSVYGLYRVTTVYYDFGAASSELPAALKAYRADGLPFVAREIAPPHLDLAQNAAPAIRAALAALHRRASAPLNAALKDPDAKADLLLATEYAKPLARLAEVVDRPRVDFARDWDLGPDLVLSEYDGMKTLAKAATLRAVREASRGDDASALRDLTLARCLALWAGQEPILISMLVRISTETIALDGVERCLAITAERPERIARYARWLESAPPLPHLGDALRGEAYMGVVVARNLDVFGGKRAISSSGGEDAEALKVDPARLRRDGLPDDAKMRGFLTRNLQLWDEGFRRTDGFRQPPEAIGSCMDRVESELDRKKGLSYFLAGVLFPRLTQAGRAVTRLEARRAVEAGLAEALTAYALTHRWPTHVSAIDPFTGAPLHVKRDVQGLRVYSVGADHRDDGGRTRLEVSKASGATYDEAAAYPPIP